MYAAQRAFASATTSNGPEQPNELEDCDVNTRAACYGLALLMTLLVTQDTADDMLKRIARVPVPNLDRAKKDRMQAVAVDQFCKIAESLDAPR